MWTMRAAVAVILVPAALAGCTTTPGRDMVGRLETGMNPVQVTAALGAPRDVRREGAREAWRYCIDNPVVDEYVVAWFEDDHLSGFDRRSDYDFGACRAEMEGFSWDDAPQPEG